MPHCFQKQSSLRRSPRKQINRCTMDRHKKRRKLGEQPRCTLPCCNVNSNMAFDMTSMPTTTKEVLVASPPETEATLKKLPPYMNLENESCDEDHSYGLSKSLSSESVKEACGRYDDDDDDVSDDDLIEIHHTPHCFQKASSLRRSLKQQTDRLTIDRHKKRRKLDVHPLCTLPRSNSSNIASPEKVFPAQIDKKILSNFAFDQDEVIDLHAVFNKLDAILDGPAASCPMQNALPVVESETSVEDCLLELDIYLDGFDDGSIMNVDDSEVVSSAEEAGTEGPENRRRRNMTLSKNIYVFPSTSNGEDANNSERLQLGHKLRRTISSDMKTDRNNIEEDVFRSLAAHQHRSSSKSINGLNSGGALECRRNSMRNTSPLTLPPSTLPANVNAASSSPEDICDEQHILPLPTSDDDPAEQQREANRQSTPCTTRETLRRCYSHSNMVTSSNSSLAISLPNPNEMLTMANILQNIIHTHAAATSSLPRPRQFGRRALDGTAGRVLTMQADALNTDNCNIRGSCQRPMTAPAAAATHSSGSEHSSLGSSRNISPVSLVSSSSTDDSSSTTTLQDPPAQPSNADALDTTVNTGTSTGDVPLDPDNVQIVARPGNNAEWPHSCSRILALICCSLGLFNISRFAVVTVQYGGNFLLQFLLLSFIFGIPLLWLQMCLGAKIRAGPVTMWRISPICKGIGIALTLVQCVLTVYSSIGVAWVLVYLRDSFLEKAQPLYRWQEPFGYRYAANSTANLTETVADYFNGFVLQRLQMVRRSDSTAVRFHISDRLAFNLALIWTFVFLVLCKGLRSYGKAVIALTIIPLAALAAVTCKLLTVIDFKALQNVFSAADFEDFLINSKTWSAAAQEAFLTWGLWGPSVIAMSSRLHANAQSKNVLRRDAILVVVTTLFGLSLAALFGLACSQILNENHFVYIPGSYEHIDSSTSVYSLKGPINTALLSFPAKWVPHYSSLVGETYRRPTLIPNQESGYQALRLISELFPAAMVLCSASVSWIWVAVAMGMFLLFGLAQMCAMWKPISSALGNSTSSVLLSCVTGLLLSIPFSTEIGIAEVYFMDLVMGGSWFIPVLWMALIFGVFLIRGRPYNGDDLVNDLRMSGSMSAFLALSWNVLLPIGLVTLAVVEYKISNSSQLYYWRGKSYFSLWARKLAGLLQIALMMIVPVTALFQILLYLTSGPPDILDRIQLLYRPSQSLLEARASRAANERRNCSNSRNTSGSGLARNSAGQAHQAINDAPPKYTPPPSYTTATGARLAKILRQSIRRSVRRLQNIRNRPEIVSDPTDQTSLPPDYTVLHMNETTERDDQRHPPDDQSCQQRTFSLGSINRQKCNFYECATIHQSPCSAVSSTEHQASRNRSPDRPYTAADVATILRSSIRRNTERRPATTVDSGASIYEDETNCSTYSAENLILNAERLSESAAIALSLGEQEEIPNHGNSGRNYEASGGDGDNNKAAVI